MDRRARELLLKTEEDLLAAQQRFVQSNEASSAQLKVKRAPAQKAGLSSSSETESSGVKGARVSWAPELTEAIEPPAVEVGTKVTQGLKQEDVSGEGLGGRGRLEETTAQKPIKILASLPISSSEHTLFISAEGAADQLHPRVGPGTDLSADDEDSGDEPGQEGDEGQYDDGRPPYQPLPIMGGIKEKGYTGGLPTGPATLPAPRVTPFPEARHRSDGPHWAPVLKKVVEPPVVEQDIVPPFDPASAIPLSKHAPPKKKAAMSKFRQAMMDSRKPGDSSHDLVGNPGESAPVAKKERQERQASGRIKRSEVAERGAVPDSQDNGLMDSYGQQALTRSGQAKGVEGMEQVPAPVVEKFDEEAIDAENRVRVAAMSAAEVAAEQAELQQMLPPGVLEALKKRGAKKLAGQQGRGAAPFGTESKMTFETGQVKENASGGSVQDTGEKGQLKRQPTPLPGAIPVVRKGPAVSLDAITEDESLEVSAEPLLNSLHREPMADELPGERGSLKRQPTPLPGVIPKAVKSGRASLGALAEETEGESDQGGALPMAEGRLLRQPTPMPGAILKQQQEPGSELDSLREEDVEDLMAEAEERTTRESVERKDTETANEGSMEGGKQRRPLLRQPTPIPGAIPAVRGPTLPALDSLEEGAEYEVGGGGPGVEQSEGQTSIERLKRQPTPMPGAIPSVKENAHSPALGPVEEGAEEEERGEEVGAGRSKAPNNVEPLKRQPTPMPGAIPSVGGTSQLPALDSLEEGAEDEEGEAGGTLQSEGSTGTKRLNRQPTPMPGAIPSPRAEQGSTMATLEEDMGEEEGAEDTAVQSERPMLKRQETPLPGAIPAPRRGLKAALEPLEEEGASDLGGSAPIPGRAPILKFERMNASDMRFDLDGALLEPKEGTPGSAAGSVASERKVAERDILRSDGDPVGGGYSLKEAAALARSAVPGQRSVALRLIAAVLKRALVGMHGGGDGADVEESGADVWARLWSYALGPDVQLAVVLRSALDDSHASVLAAAAQALATVLACEENESLLEETEAGWRGPWEPVSNFEGPCSRSTGVLMNGVGNWGRWAAKATVTAMTGAATDEETVGDNAQLASADVAAGLIRMGILPRIRFILEVLGLPALDEPLLDVLIALSRHSAAAALAVRDCPRLLPTLHSIFIGLPPPMVRSHVPSPAAQGKAVKLLRVLSQADRASAALLCDHGLLQLAKRHLFSQPPAPTPLRYLPAFSEVLRLWRTCALYGLGGGSFPDYYSALCFLLEAPAGARGADDGPPWKESAEAYLLLEALARTLPSARDSSDSDGGEGLLEWATVGPLVEGASQWLSTRVLKLVLEPGGGGQSAPPVRALSAVLHFLATVCERNAGQLGRLVRTVVDALLAEGGFLPRWEAPASFESMQREGSAGTEIGGQAVDAKRKTRPSFLDLLTEMASAQQESGAGALAAVSCLQGLLRLTSALAARERLGARSEETTALVGSSSSEGHAGTDLEEAEAQKSGPTIEQLMEVKFGAVADKLAEEVAGSESVQVAKVSGRELSTAAGLGLGWGLAARGICGKGLEVWRARADLLARLFEILPVRGVLVHTVDAATKHGKETEGGQKFEEGTPWSGNGKSEAAWLRFRASLQMVRTARPGNFKLVLSVLSSSVLSTEVLEVLLSEGAALLGRAEETAGNIGGSARARLPSAAEMRQVLLPHFASQWLSLTSEDPDADSLSNDWDVEAEVGKLLDADSDTAKTSPSCTAEGWLRLRLPAEHRTSSASKGPTAVSAPIAGQKLPLPSDWILSPTAVAAHLSTSILTSSGATDIDQGVKRLVRSGLALLLGLEACRSLEAPGRQSGDRARAESLLAVPLARKLHALSEVFLAAGELFMDDDIAPVLQILQELYSERLPTSRGGPSDLPAGEYKTNFEQAPSKPVTAMRPQNEEGLDFAAAVGGPYEGFAESLAEQFAATSFGDPVFGRQVALLLRMDVTPGGLRLVVWRALADARALHLLPPVAECLGDSTAYLYPTEGSKEALELYASTLSSGPLDRTITLGKDAMAVTALIAIHHLSKALAASVTVSGGGEETQEASASSQSIEVPTRDSMEGTVLGGFQGLAKDEQKRMVHRLVRNLLLGVAHGTAEASTLVALVTYGMDSAGSGDSPDVKRNSENSLAPLYEAAGADRTMVGVLQALKI